jgi:hypothetical protein
LFHVNVQEAELTELRFAVSVFPDELYPAPRSWAEKAYPKLVHYNKVPKGGHFAAWAQPQLFCEERRTDLDHRDQPWQNRQHEL